MPVTTSTPSARDRFLSALIIGAVIGVFVGAFVKMFVTPIRTIPEQMKLSTQRKIEKVIPKSQGPINLPENHPTLVYIRAYQNDDWEKVIQKTLWITERLKKVYEETKSEDKVEEVENSIIKDISNRDINSNYVKKNGVEDQYLFTKEATIIPVAWDRAGPFDDERVKEKVWFLIEYPKPSVALRDERQLPIKSLIVALSVDNEGRIVKSNIIGNAEILRESIKLWETSKGG